MSFDVHPLMQDTDDVDGFIRFAIEHNVRTSGVAKISVANNANPPRFFAARQRFHGANQIAVIVLCLLRRPMLGGIAPNVFKIAFSQRGQPKLSAFNRHAWPACGPGRPRCRRAWASPTLHPPSMLPAMHAFAFRVIRGAATRLARRHLRNHIVPIAPAHRQILQSDRQGKRMCFAT
ncbi:hypothetical protein I35_1615 [Burkholderia cenocepacia H111]|nr:hypothetical protein I35_1615 [Burkholderia cenocepacia H111]